MSSSVDPHRSPLANGMNLGRPPDPQKITDTSLHGRHVSSSWFRTPPLWPTGVCQGVLDADTPKKRPLFPSVDLWRWVSVGWYERLGLGLHQWSGGRVPGCIRGWMGWWGLRLHSRIFRHFLCFLAIFGFEINIFRQNKK